MEKAPTLSFTSSSKNGDFAPDASYTSVGVFVQDEIYSFEPGQGVYPLFTCPAPSPDAHAILTEFIDGEVLLVWNNGQIQRLHDQDGSEIASRQLPNARNHSSRSQVVACT